MTAALTENPTRSEVTPMQCVEEIARFLQPFFTPLG